MTLHDTAATPAPSPLSDPVALIEAQLRAVDLWHAALHATRASAEAPGLSREARLDAARRLGVRRREQEVILQRVSELDGVEKGPLQLTVPVRAVVAHRHEWTRDAVAEALRGRGVEVLAVTDNGADAVGVAVCEQPDVVVLDETLAMRSGAEVAHEVVQFCPHTLVAGYVARDDAVARLLEAGATPVFTRRMPPAVVTERLLALVRR